MFKRIPKRFRSIKFILYVVLLAIALLLVSRSVVASQLLTNLERYTALIENSSEVRAHAYRLSALVRQIAQTDDATFRAGINATIIDLIEETDQQIANIETLGESLSNNMPLEALQLAYDTMVQDWQILKQVIDNTLENPDRISDAQLSSIEAQANSTYLSAEQFVKITEVNAQITISNSTTNALGVTVFALVAVIFLFVLIGRLLYELRELSLATKDFGDGKFDRRVSELRFSEFQNFGETLNNMAEYITRLVSHLEKRAQDAKNAQMAAEQANRAKLAFLATMSHELRTPLNAIINFSRSVSRGDVGAVTEKQAELLEMVNKNGKSLLLLINDVMDITKIESGGLGLFVAEGVDVKTILEAAALNAKALLEDKPVQLITEFAPDMPLIRADRQRVNQIILNMVSNACKFTEKGSILLKLHKQGEELIITVKDTGPGISSEEQAAVFQAFKQTKSGLAHGGGTGLGMSISKNLAEAHGGRLWLESTAGQGATFYLALPIEAKTKVPTVRDSREIQAII
jgi:signal transduction histidine kinase